MNMIIGAEPAEAAQRNCFSQSRSILERIRPLPLALVSACLVFIILRLLVPGSRWGHPDEIIPIRIIEHILLTGNWDTNWLRADLPDYFKYDQYNFSSYIVACAVAIKFLSGLLSLLEVSVNIGKILILLNVLTHLATIILTFHAGKLFFSSSRVGMVSAWITATFPLLYKNTLYARPESFVDLLTLLVMVICFEQYRSPRIRLAAFAGVLIGFLIACKITFVVLIPLAVFALGKAGRNYRAVMLVFGTFLLCLAAGFVAGAPYALFNFSSYLNGLSVLFNQYGSVHPPHGLPDGSMLERLLYSFKYFLAIGEGPFLFLGFIGCCLLLIQRRHIYLSAGFISLAAIVYFSIKPVYFERNFSFCIPYLSLCAAFGLQRIIDRFFRNPTFRTIALATSLFVLIAPSLVFLIELDRNVLGMKSRRSELEFRQKLEKEYAVPVRTVGWVVVDKVYKELREKVAEDSSGAIYEIWGANDRQTAETINFAIGEFGLEKIAELHSPLRKFGLPPSTLYTYHAPEYVYLMRMRSN